MPAPALAELKKKILHFFASHPRETFKPRVLARRLGATDLQQFRALSQALNELFQARAITRESRKRYGHAVPPETPGAGPPESRRIGAPHSRGARLTGQPARILAGGQAVHPVAKRMNGVLEYIRGGNGIVQLLPPDKGSVTIPERFIATALPGDRVSVALLAFPEEEEAGTAGGAMEAEIVEVLERGGRPVVGVLEKQRNLFFVDPDDRKIGRNIFIPPGKMKGARPGQKVVVKITSWESRNLPPEGMVTEVLGKSGEVGAEMAAVAREFQLPLRFPKDILDEAEKISDEIPAEEMRRRLDLRDLTCFTIDPEDAKDFDDAISLEDPGDGSLRLGVHIADVSHYVREGSALDVEAYTRGTSVYLADSVIPMLPEELSNVVCSLRPEEDRLTYSVIVTFDARGTIKDYDIRKSVIHSKRRFTYEEVQKIIDSGRGEFRETVARMHALSQSLLRKRMAAGGIDFESRETKFRYDDKGRPVEILKKDRLGAHRLVEEFMLLANRIVAEHIGRVKSQGHQRPFIYRIHEPPPPDKLRDFASFVEHLGHTLNISRGVTPRALQKLLADVKGKDEEAVINEIAIRTMAKAIYSDANAGHFGLGFEYYTHFTSPIRRYPDLVVHRALEEYGGRMTLKRGDHYRTILPEVCSHSSARERVAMEAERASVKVMKVEYMKRHVGDEFQAIISGVMKFGLFVEITDLLVEGLIHIRDLEDDYYVLDEKHYQLVGRRTKRRFRLGDKVRIRVVRVDPEEREIDFALAD